MASSDPREAFTTPFDSACAIGQVAADESLVSRARALGPFIREHAAVTERERRLARPVLEAMREAGLFRMFTHGLQDRTREEPVAVGGGGEVLARAHRA